MTFDIQACVTKAKQGDLVSYEALIANYLPRIRGQASQMASRNPKIDAAHAESRLLWALHQTIEDYDPSVGPFVNYANYRMAKEAKNVSYRASTSASSRNESMISLNSPTSGSDESASIECIDHVPSLTELENEVIADLTVLAYMEKVGKNDPLLSKVVEALANGFRLNEVAYSCGYEGSQQGAIHWTQRRINKIRTILSEEMTA